VAEAYVGLLDGRPVRVGAARFGGIVAEPTSFGPEGIGPVQITDETGHPDEGPPRG
jgi:hypothetical protein